MTNKTKEIESFLKDPFVKESYDQKDWMEVGRMAMMAGNLEKSAALREFGQKMMDRAMGEGQEHEPT
jgi:hypothetical protein